MNIEQLKYGSYDDFILDSPDTVPERVRTLGSSVDMMTSVMDKSPVTAILLGAAALLTLRGEK